MTFDRAGWHSGGDFPEELPPENGGTHIGMYLGWAFKRGLTGQMHLDHEPAAVEKVRSGKMSGRDFLFDYCDEKFTSESLNEEGVAFTESYYDERYLDDYCGCFTDEESVYHVENSPENQARMEAVLDARLAAWRNQGRKKPWWRFW